MMNEKAAALKCKRVALVAQIAAERDSIARQSAVFRPVARMIDKVNAGVHYVKRHPVVLLLPITLIALWRPRNFLAITVKGFGLWRLAQSGRNFLRK